LSVLGFDKSEDKVSIINNSIKYISDIADDTFNKVVYDGFLTASTNFELYKITTNHSSFDSNDILKKSKLIVDLRNLIKESSDKY